MNNCESKTCKKTIVQITIDGGVFSVVFWKDIPRVGDILRFNNGAVYAVVKHVVWAENFKAGPLESQQLVQLVCKSTSPEKHGLKRSLYVVNDDIE